MRDDRSTSRRLLARYFGEIRRKPRLSRERERELARRIRKGDRLAINELVESNLVFVAKVALEYRNLGLPYEDLLNEGNLGLIEAARRFDGNRGIKFVTYAFWWIRKSILKALNDHATTVRVPASRRYRAWRLRRFEAEGGARSPGSTAPEDAPAPSADPILRGERFILSLEQEIGSRQPRKLADVLADESGLSIDDRLIEVESRRRIDEALCELTDEERFVIIRRFGLEGEVRQSLREIGHQMGVTREWVRQLESRSKRKLRRVLARSPEAPTAGAGRRSRGTGEPESPRIVEIRPRF